MGKTKKKVEKNSSFVLIIGLIIIILFVLNLDNLNMFSLNKNDSDIEEIETIDEKEKIPTNYNCSYGPIVDSFYNYIKSEYVTFEFNNDGKVSKISSEEKYQATTQDDYSYMLSLLSFSSENVSYDEKNYVVTVKDNKVDKYPRDYKLLNEYLSENGYICSKK